VLSEAREIYVFELRGLRFCGPWVSFYIRPADGFELPVIMQWVKQTYAVRYNVYDGRPGHIWGDRYWSEILPGEPPEDAEEYVFLPAVYAAGDGGASRQIRVETRRLRRAVRRRDTEGRPRMGRRAVKPPQRAGSPRNPADSHG
jgi:hypothetical protein